MACLARVCAAFGGVHGHSVHTHPADRHPVDAFIRSWGLACAGIIGPVLLGIVANSYFVERVNSGSELCAIARQLSFSLIGEASPTTVKFSPEETKACDAAVAEHFPKAALIPAPTPVAPPQAAPAAPSTATVAINTSGAGDKLPPQLSILANHIAGRLNVAYAYSFLALVSFFVRICDSDLQTKVRRLARPHGDLIGRRHRDFCS